MSFLVVAEATGAQGPDFEADRLEARGCSGSSLLRMSRAELGSYLGLKPETMSRTLTKLQADGLLLVCKRRITITDSKRLQQLLDGECVA